MLDLMTVVIAHKARPERFTSIVRQQLEAVRLGRIDWRSHWDPVVRQEGGRKVKPRNTLIEYRNMARERNAIAREDEDRAATAAAYHARVEATWAETIADGGQPSHRVLRTTERTTLARPGDMIADVPHLMEKWDFSRNIGLDPAAIAAQSNGSVDWVCDGHAAGDPDGKWPGHFHRWSQSPSQRAMSDPGCRFCMRRKACVATCLRTTHPKLARADEWDYKTNDAAGVTPDNKLSGSKTEVSWLCKRHGPYLMTIYDRTRTGKRCRPCTDETAREKRRITLQAKGKARHLLAVQGRERLNAERDEAEGEPSG